MNPKIKKVDANIQKMEARLAETQAALKDLRAEKKMLEDLEIVKAIRSMKNPDMDVMALIEKMQSGGGIPASFVSEANQPDQAEDKESEVDENE